VPAALVRPSGVVDQSRSLDIALIIANVQLAQVSSAVLRIFRHYVSASALGLFLCESLTIVIVLSAAVSVVTSSTSGSDGAIFAVVGAVLLPTALISVLTYAFGLYEKSLITNFRRSLPRPAVCRMCAGHCRLDAFRARFTIQSGRQ